MRVSNFSLLYTTVIATEVVEQTSEKATDDEKANWGHLLSPAQQGEYICVSGTRKQEFMIAHSNPNSIQTQPADSTLQPAATVKLSAHSPGQKLLKLQGTIREFVSFMPS